MINLSISRKKFLLMFKKRCIYNLLQAQVDIYKGQNKMLKTILLSLYTLLKKICVWIFWFLFLSLFTLQIIIFSKMWEDWTSGIETPIKAMVLYVLLTVAFLGSLLMKNKILLYVFAIGNIVLFLYLSSKPELNSYFGYFDALD